MNAGVSTDVAAVEHSPLTRSSSPPVFAWPGWRHLRQTMWYSALTAALFAVVFGGADALSRLHSYRVDLAIPADGSIPFVPAATLIYSSLYVMFWLVPFVLRTERTRSRRWHRSSHGRSSSRRRSLSRCQCPNGPCRRIWAVCRCLSSSRLDQPSAQPVSLTACDVCADGGRRSRTGDARASAPGDRRMDPRDCRFDAVDLAARHRGRRRGVRADSRRAVSQLHHRPATHRTRFNRESSQRATRGAAFVVFRLPQPGDRDRSGHYLEPASATRWFCFAAGAAV